MLYYALLTVRNGAGTVEDAIRSLHEQTAPPNVTFVVDDGSTDATPQVLERLRQELPSLRILRRPDRGYDIRRIVHNWNLAIEASRTERTNWAYHFISADDCIYPPYYCARLLAEMRRDPSLAVVSGDCDPSPSPDGFRLPRGAGRLVDESFFRQVGERYPPFYGYEPWICFKALQCGRQIKNIPDLRYSHLRGFGSGHRFREWGYTMRALGYPAWFVLARVVKNSVANRRIPLGGNMDMLVRYFMVPRGNPYFRYHEPELRAFIRGLHARRAASVLLHRSPR